MLWGQEFHDLVLGGSMGKKKRPDEKVYTWHFFFFNVWDFCWTNSSLKHLKAGLSVLITIRG